MNKSSDEIILAGARIVVKELIKAHGHEIMCPKGSLAHIIIWVRCRGEDDSEIEVEKIAGRISYKGKINLPNR